MPGLPWSGTWLLAGTHGTLCSLTVEDPALVPLPGTSLEVARSGERLRDAAHEVLGPVPGSEGTRSITAGPGQELCQGLKEKPDTGMSS